MQHMEIISICNAKTPKLVHMSKVLLDCVWINQRSIAIHFTNHAIHCIIRSCTIGRTFPVREIVNKKNQQKKSLFGIGLHDKDKCHVLLTY